MVLNELPGTISLASKASGTVGQQQFPRNISVGSFVGVGSFGTWAAQFWRGNVGSFSGTLTMPVQRGRVLSKATAITVSLGANNAPPPYARFLQVTAQLIATAGQSAGLAIVQNRQPNGGTLCAPTWPAATGGISRPVTVILLPGSLAGSWRFQRINGDASSNWINPTGADP